MDTNIYRLPGKYVITGENRVEDSNDPFIFARERLGFDADEAQALVLRGGRRGIVNCSRQWGKSTVAAAKAVHHACAMAGSLTILLSPSGRQSGEFLRKAEEFVRRLGIKARGDGDNELSILLPNGPRVVGLPGNETTVRGYSNVSLMLIDEASRVPDEIYQAMRPSLAACDGDLWLMSTPNGKRGFFWEAWAHGGEAWKRVQVTGPDCPRISARMLEEERAAQGESLFRQEYMCCFEEREGAVFPEELIEAMRHDYDALKI